MDPHEEVTNESMIPEVGGAGQQAAPQTVFVANRLLSGSQGVRVPAEKGHVRTATDRRRTQAKPIPDDPPETTAAFVKGAVVIPVPMVRQGCL